MADTPSPSDPAVPSGSRKLVRPARGGGRMIAGVCRAIADRFGVSVGLVRLAFIVFGLVGAGELVYLLLWLLIPKADRGSRSG